MELYEVIDVSFEIFLSNIFLIFFKIYQLTEERVLFLL